nr:TGS domain-containing protein [Desulfuromonadales bacterium]
TMAVSATTGEGLDTLGPWLMENLGVVRVYTKLPGESADGSAPFTIRSGQTVMDIAVQIHKDVAAGLKYARVWGQNSFDGQQVGRDYQPIDGDVLELHA